METVEISQVSTTRFLGIFVDENLNWKTQIDWVSKKINKSIGIIRRISNLITTNCLLTLYYSLIYPYLSYCNIVWASTFPSTLHRILVLQKRFVRIATRSESHSSSVPLFQNLQILTVYDINITQICVFIYKVHFNYENIPEHFKTYFKFNSQVHAYSTRQSLDLHLPKFLTCRGQFTIRFRGTKLWNSFSHLAINSSSLKCYKRYLKAHLTAVLNF